MGNGNDLNASSNYRSAILDVNPPAFVDIPLILYRHLDVLFDNNDASHLVNHYFFLLFLAFSFLISWVLLALGQ